MADAKRLEYELRLRDLATKTLQKFGRGVKTETTKAQAAFQKLNKITKRVGTEIKTAFGAAVFAGLRSGMRRVTEFSKAMGEVRTIMDESSMSFQDANENVKALALELGAPAPEVAAALYQTLSAGVTESAQAMIMLRQATELGIAGVATTKESVDLLTTVFNAYVMTVTEQGVEKTSDMIFKMVQLGKNTIPELSSAMGQLLPQAAQLGVPFEEAAAAVSTLTLSGLSVNEAVTQVSAVLTAFMKNADTAAKELPHLSGVMGATAIRSKGFTQAIEDLADATGGSEDMLVKLMGRVEGAKAVMALTGIQSDKFASQIKDIGEASGTTGTALDLMLDTTAKKMDILKEAWVQGWEEMLKSATDVAEDTPIEEVQKSAEAIKTSLGGIGVLLTPLVESLKGLGALGHSAAADWNAMSGDMDAARSSQASIVESLAASGFNSEDLRASLEKTAFTLRAINSDFEGTSRRYDAAATDFIERYERFADIQRDRNIATKQELVEQSHLYEALTSQLERMGEIDADRARRMAEGANFLREYLALDPDELKPFIEPDEIAEGLEAAMAPLHDLQNVWDVLNEEQLATYQRHLVDMIENEKIVNMTLAEGIEKRKGKVVAASVFEVEQYKLKQKAELLAAKTKLDEEGAYTEEVRNKILARYVAEQQKRLAVFTEARETQEQREIDAIDREESARVKAAKRAAQEAQIARAKIMSEWGPIIEKVLADPWNAIAVIAGEAGARSAAAYAEGLKDKLGVDLAESAGGALGGISAFFEETPTFAYENLVEQIQNAKAEAQALHDQDLISDKQLTDMEAMIANVEKYALAEAKARAQTELFKTSLSGMAEVSAGVKLGFDGFIEGIPEMGDAMAEVTAGAMSNFASGLTNAFMAMAQGTKSAGEAFREFAAQFIVQTMSMIVQVLILKAIKTAAGMAEGGVVQGGLGSITPLAGGGVVAGGMGRLLPVKGYATGGPIVSQPHLAIIGEGKQSEAVVPLPDGRSIPVDLGGDGGAQIAITINAVDARGIRELLIEEQDTIRGVVRQGMTEDRLFRQSMRAGG